MSNKFYSIKVNQIEKTTANCSVLTFDINPELIEKFDFIQGQYLTLKANINGEEIRRSYSLCSSPNEKKWQVAIKKIEDGKFSSYANDVLKAGDVLEVMPPNGRFYVKSDATKATNYIAFAAGSGITPIVSIIKTHLQSEPQSTFKLFYFNQAVSTIILKEEVEALKNQFLGRFEIFHFLTREKRNIEFFNGRLNKEKLDTIFNKIVHKEEVHHSFVCGPNQMIFLVRDYLTELGFQKNQIHFELFNTNTNETGKPRKKRKVDAGKMAEINIIEGGKTITFNIPQGSDNILDAGMKQNMDLPFACKGGVCCTCRAKLLEGKVDMEVNYALEQEELDEGYILTCQAVPLSKKVVVDFDA